MWQPHLALMVARNLGTFADIIDGILNGLNFFSILIGNLDVKFFFKGHDQFNGIQGVRPEIVHEGRFVGHLILIHTQLLCNNLLDTLINTGHCTILLVVSIRSLTASFMLCIYTVVYIYMPPLIPRT